MLTQGKRGRVVQYKNIIWCIVHRTHHEITSLSRQKNTNEKIKVSIHLTEGKKTPDLLKAPSVSIHACLEKRHRLHAHSLKEPRTY